MNIINRYPVKIKEFKCIGCGECCQNWGITIDKKTYKKYEQIFDKSLEGLNYPFFYRKDDIDYFCLYEGKCVFLLDNNNCYIHKNYDSEMKCNTCRIYPTLEFFTNQYLDNSLTFSCNATLELLDDTSKFEIKEVKLKINNFLPINSLLLLDSLNISTEIFTFLETNIFEFLVENYKYDIEQKMIIVSVWIRLLYEKIAGSVNKDVKKIVEKFTDDLLNHTETIENVIKTIPISLGAQLKFIVLLFNNARSLYIAEKDYYYIKVINKLFDYLLINKDGSYKLSKTIAKYKQLLRTYYKSYEDFEYIYSKYIYYNYFSKRTFKKSSIIKGYNTVIVSFALVKLLIPFFALDDDEINFTHIKKAIKFVEKYFLHANKIFGFWNSKESETFLNTLSFSKIILGRISSISGTLD